MKFQVFAGNPNFQGTRARVYFQDGKAVTDLHHAMVLVRNWKYTSPEINLAGVENVLAAVRDNGFDPKKDDPVSAGIELLPGDSADDLPESLNADGGESTDELLINPAELPQSTVTVDGKEVAGTVEEAKEPGQEPVTESKKTGGRRKK
jgi:hypothetical protein